MVKIEVEHRGLLTKKQFNNLNKYFLKNGSFIAEKDRFSLIYSPQEKETSRTYKGAKDLRLRITNKETELVLKYGKQGGNDSRKEFQFPIDSKNFEEAVEFLSILGYHYGALQATKSFLYMYEGIDFVLVEVPDFGYYFEAEILTNSDLIKSANEKIREICQRLKLDILNDQEFWKLIEDLNKRPGYRFSFKKERFLEVKKRFINYF